MKCDVSQYHQILTEPIQTVHCGVKENKEMRKEKEEEDESEPVQ